MLSNSYHMLLKDYITVIFYIINLICCVTLDNICIALYFPDDTIIHIIHISIIACDKNMYFPDDTIIHIIHISIIACDKNMSIREWTSICITPNTATRFHQWRSSREKA